MNNREETGLGNYFIANYPPFSFWTPAHLPAALAALACPGDRVTPLGLYLHIPFCRKRCKFCYFRVYTDKNARDVELYLDALVNEVRMLAQSRCVAGRKLHFVYFGGGTPSYLSAAQLRGLIERLQAIMPWDAAREVTFECEPGTLQLHKLETLKELGVTRLSLGIENFNPEILRVNGRAHLEDEIYAAYRWARQVGFNQINVDLIAGMVGETDANWRECIKKTLQLAPESVTIYQMELPYNTTFSKSLTLHDADEPPPGSIADWPTKRRWVDEAFSAFRQAGYQQSSAYTVVKDRVRTQFVYRDALWHGADMLGTGVASFGHVNGVHMQNHDTWEAYIAALQRDDLPLKRALPVTPRQRLIRELVLQLKTGQVAAEYFQQKFGTEILREFQAQFEQLERGGWLTVEQGAVKLTNAGLLQIDRHLPIFFEPEHVTTRYT